MKKPVVQCWLLGQTKRLDFSYYLFIENVEEVGLKSHKFKLFNPIKEQKLNIKLPNSFYNNMKYLVLVNLLEKGSI